MKLKLPKIKIKAPKLPDLGDVANTIADVGLNIATGGLVGFNDGRIGQGLVFNAADELSQALGLDLERGDLFNYGVNFGTLGLLGYEDGRFRTGGVLHALDEGIGEMTGRNLYREQMHRAQARLAEEAELRRQQMADEQARRQRMDLQASRAALTRRSNANTRGGAVQGTFGVLGEDGDFLGL